MGLVVPAVLPSSRDDLLGKIGRFAALGVPRIQIDVVDGKFASPKSWPYTAPKEFELMRSAGAMLPYLDRIEYEIDLMCVDAERAADICLALGATRLTFHAESLLDLRRSLATMQGRYGDLSAAFGIALNVTTAPSLIEPCLDLIGYVQFMGIDSIGKQGQPFDPRVIETVRAFHAAHPDMPLQADGGVSLPVADALVSAGVTNLVVGSALLRAADPAAELEKFEALQTPFGV